MSCQRDVVENKIEEDGNPVQGDKMKSNEETKDIKKVIETNENDLLISRLAEFYGKKFSQDLE